MKEISNYLIHFIEKYLIHNKKNISNLGSHYSLFVENMIQQMEKAEIEYHKTFPTISKQELVLTKTEFPKTTDYSIIPENIRLNIESKDKKGIHYKFSIHEQIIELFIMYPLESQEKREKDSKQKWNRFFESCLKKVYMWLFMAYPYKNKSCSQQLKIYLYLSNLPKLIDPSKKTILNQEMINTAFTYACIADNSIILFREEEWFKVFIHETFHSLGFDFSGSPSLTEIAKNKILNLFSIQSDVLLYETYTELNAEILNVLFFVYFTTKKKNLSSNNYEAFIKKFDKYMNYERLFSCFQCVKVLHYNQTAYQDIISKKTNKYREQTNVFVYYILKSVLMTYYKEYLDWIITNNDGSLNFIKTESQLNEFIQLIQKNYMNSDFLEKIEEMENWFSKNSKKNNIETKTLRMTAIEF
jgi:hypothetical protein